MKHGDWAAWEHRWANAVEKQFGKGARWYIFSQFEIAGGRFWYAAFVTLLAFLANATVADGFVLGEIPGLTPGGVARIGSLGGR